VSPLARQRRRKTSSLGYRNLGPVPLRQVSPSVLHSGRGTSTPWESPPAPSYAESAGRITHRAPTSSLSEPDETLFGQCRGPGFTLVDGMADTPKPKRLVDEAAIKRKYRCTTWFVKIHVVG